MEVAFLGASGKPEERPRHESPRDVQTTPFRLTGATTEIPPVPAVRTCRAHLPQQGPLRRDPYARESYPP